MNSQILFAGVDVSSETLDIHYNLENGKELTLQVPNTPVGHKEVVQKLGTRCYVMEATGPYYLRFAFVLKASGADVRLENPLVIKRYIQMHMERNKSDKKDASWIFRYALEQKAPVWNPPTEQSLKCNAILASIDLYSRQHTQLSNQIHAFSQLPADTKEIIKGIQKTIDHIDKEIAKLELRLQQILQSWKAEQLKCLTTIPGLGKRATALLIIYTDGFTKINNHRQLIALAGLAPREYSSGSSIRGKRGICKMGNDHLRNVLYMCSMSAIKCNKACKDLYERLKAKGKRGKVALIAVCNKLLKQAFAIATKLQMYQSEYVSKKPEKLLGF
jgi:transposase